METANQKVPLQGAEGALLAYLNLVKNQIIAAATEKGMNGSGKTLATLEIVETGKGYDLLADPSIWFMEHGRGPTRPGTPAGNPNLVEIIREWLDAKGFDINPYAVANTIHKSGARLYRSGGNSGVLTVPLNLDRLDEGFNQVSAEHLDNIAQQVFDAMEAPPNPPQRRGL